MRGKSTSSGAALLVCSLLCACTTDGFNIDAGLVRLSLEGDVALGPSAGGPVDLDSIENDVDDSLGFDDEERTPYIAVEFWHERLSVTMSTLWYSQDSTGILDRDFGDIPQGSAVSTSADIVNVKAALYYDLVSNESFRLSPGIGIDYMDLDISATVGGLTDAIDTGIPIPMVYLRAETDFGPFTASLDAGGFSLDVLGVDATLVDLEAMLRFNPVPLVEVFGGYRALLLDAAGDDGGQDFETDLLLHGWIIGLELPF